MSVIVFIFGLLIGSFLNVVIYRVPRKESIVFLSSHCPDCGERLKAVDLIPVLSFLVYRGRCRYCGEKINWQYPLVELLTAVLYLLLFLKFNFQAEFFVYLILFSLLIVISIIDLRFKIIPNVITYPGIFAGLILSLIFHHITYLSLLIGFFFPAVLLLLIALLYQKGMGMGDVKLLAMIGTFTGYQMASIGLFLGSFIGAVMGTAAMVIGVVNRKTRIPFGPFISTGTIIIILYGDKLLKLLYKMG